VAVWQFVVLTALLGALLVYASVLTRTIGYANDRLKKIEEALLAKDRSVVHAEARTSGKEREVIRKEPRVGYWTILDLKGRGHRLSSHAARSTRPSSAPIPERLDAPTAAPIVESAPKALPLGNPIVASTEADQGTNARHEQESCDETSPLRGNTVVLSLENDQAAEAIDEPPTSPTMPVVSADPVTTTSDISDPVEKKQAGLSLLGAAPANEALTVSPPETHAAPEPTSEKLIAPSRRHLNEDPAARKRREMAYYLSSQRRRRRARMGY
jgi:hypothetical protein